MTQPKLPPLSVRIPADLLEAVETWAKEAGVKRNGAVIELLRRGLAGGEPEILQVRRLPPAPLAWPSGAVLLPEHTADPGPSAPLRVIKQAEASKFPRAPYGSRLKTKR